MGAKQETIQAAEQEYAKLRAAVHGLDETRLTQVWLGTWGVREIMAHIAGWHREMVPAVDRLARGEPPYPDGTYDDFDAWNARFVEGRTGMKTADILDEADRSHRELLHVAGQLSDEQLVPGQAARALIDGVAADHYREHAAQIVDWRRRGGP
jgi:hypothetical protein